MSANSPWFQRSPRMKSPLPCGEMEIVKPPNAPTKPTLSAATIILPVMTTLVTGGVMYYFYSKQSTTGASYAVIYLVSYGVMGMSYVLTAFTHIFKVRQYKRELRKRKQDYMERLDRYRAELEQARQRQKKILLETDPTPEQCAARVIHRTSKLWERSPRDEDFLTLRLGTGELPMSLHVKAPQQDEFQEDPLIKAACELASEYQTVKNIPIRLPIAEAAVLGIVGKRADVMDVVRTLLVQLATHHAPDEVKVASFFQPDEAVEWEWVRWLPHTWDNERTFRYLAQNRATAHQVIDTLYEAISRRRAPAAPQRGAVPVPRFVFLLPSVAMVENEPIYPMLLNEGAALGAYTILLADRREALPMQCTAIVEAGPGTSKIIRTDGPSGVTEQAFRSDSVDPMFAEKFARKLASIRVKSVTQAEIPKILRFLDLYGVSQVDSLDVSLRWSKHRYPTSLPVPIGVRAGGKPVILNIHDKVERKGHGPHGLIAGTTGSGKSEVIQAIIASLAVHYHPHDVVFMLIDYKGGGMSNTFADLPHVVASITNLEDTGLIERAKVSLRAELQRRQRLFNEAGNLQHIDEYYQSSMRESHPLPHLVIVIDEFAELKRDHPEFMNELISIAAIGRTLGVHLILATQKPAGVVDDKIWSNARFRMCLRVQDEADSRDMLRTPDAAWITTPGRGYLQVGSNEVFELFQSAWSGAPYEPDAATKEVNQGLLTVQLHGSTSNISGVHGDKTESAKVRKQLQVVTEHIQSIARTHRIETLPGPWTPPLGRELYLPDISDELRGDWDLSWWKPSSSWLHPVIGLSDDTTRQRQDPIRINLQEGHLVVYGMPGTGKTTFLQTTLISLAATHSPDELHIYVLDFGRMLRDFGQLPHVAGVVHEEDTERVSRLFRMLTKELNRRKELFSEVGTKTLAGYREAAGVRLPAVVVVIDGYINFRNTFPEDHDAFEPLLREGANFGVYFIVTTHRVSDMFEKVRSNIPLAVSFELADASEYYMAVGRPGRSFQGVPEGRGLMKGPVPPMEFQTALPVVGQDERLRTAALRQWVLGMRNAWNGACAPEIPVLPETLLLADILRQHGSEGNGHRNVPVGLQVDSLEPLCVNLEDGPYFIVGGRMEGGKTAFLCTWILGLAYHCAPTDIRLFLVDVRRTPRGLSSLRNLPHVERWAVDETELTQLLQEVKEEVDKRAPVFSDGLEDNTQVPSSVPPLVLVMDDVDLLCKQCGPTVQSDLEYIVRRGRDKHVYIVVSGVPTDLNSLNFSNKWLAEMKALQKGFLLGTAEYNDVQYFNLRLPSGEKADLLPAGQGLYIRRQAVKLKAAMPFSEADSPATWVNLITERWATAQILDTK